MAVAIDTSAGVTGNAVGSLTTASFTIGSGTDRAYVIGETHHQTGITVSSTTCGTVGGTVAGARAVSGSATCTIWAGANPSSGSQTASVTYSDTFGTKLGLAVTTFTGVDQTTPITDYTTATGTGTTSTLTVANVTADDFVFDVTKENSGGAWTAGANQTRQYFTDDRIAISTQDGADGGVMSWTYEFSAAYVLAGVRVAAVAAAGTNPKGPLSNPLAGPFGGPI